MRVFLEITIGQMCVFSPITTWVTKANHKLRIKQKKEVKVAQSYSTLCDPMDYTVHGNFQARILEWEAFPSPGYLPNPGIEPRPPALQADSLPAEPRGTGHNHCPTGIHTGKEHKGTRLGDVTLDKRL